KPFTISLSAKYPPDELGIVPLRRGSKRTLDGPPGFMPKEMIREFCDKHYNQLLPLMAENFHQEKLKESFYRRKKSKKRQKSSPNTKSITSLPSQSPSVFSRLRHEDSEPSHRENLAGTDVFTRLGEKERNVFTGLGNRKPDMFSRLGSRDRLRREQRPDPKSRSHVWFDELPPESIYSFVELRKAFLTYFLQQKKYIKDLVEIYHIKQREGESTKAFIDCFKARSLHVKGVPECLRISRFMHNITNPDIIKRLKDNIPKSIDEMMRATTTFLKREVVIANI
ncbi:reverse transcriptase domain-containing protein, partial [Tanacetum coccineum]